MVDAARERNIPIRIGVNAGSLEKDLQKKYGELTWKPYSNRPCATSIISIAGLPELRGQRQGLRRLHGRRRPYRLLARQIQSPLHLGITEAGGLRSGTVKSAVGLGMLLAEGIGDTIRISLAADPVEERSRSVSTSSVPAPALPWHQLHRLPSCSRQNFDVVKTMNELEGRLEDLLVPMDVAVIGCVVNGPGEARRPMSASPAALEPGVYRRQAVAETDQRQPGGRAGTADPPEGGEKAEGRCKPDRPQLTRLRTLREQSPCKPFVA